MKPFLTISLVLALCGAGGAAQPQDQSRVSDQAGLFSPETIREAEEELRKLELDQGWPVLIVTIESLGGQADKDRANAEAKKKGFRGGLFFLVSKQDRKASSFASDDLSVVFNTPRRRSILTPLLLSFKENQFDAGLLAAIAELRNIAQSPSDPILVLDTGGHTAAVNKVLFTPDGKQLISVSDDKTIRIWDVASDNPSRVIRTPIGRGAEGMLSAAAISPDGRTLAVAGWGFSSWKGSRIHMISYPSGRAERLLQGHPSPIHDLTFSGDGSRIASAGSDGTARIWNVGSGRCEQILKGHKSPVCSLAFSPDGAHLATASSSDQFARIWSVATGQMEVELRQKDVAWGDTCVAWRPDGKVLATGGSNCAVSFWSPEGKPFKGFQGSCGGSVNSLMFTPDSRQLLMTTVGPDYFKKGAAVCDLIAGPDHTISWHGNAAMTHGALSPDSTLAATAAGNTVYLWTTSDARLFRTLKSRGTVVCSAAWDPDGPAIAWGNTPEGLPFGADWMHFKVGQHNTFTPMSPIDARTPLERAFRLSDLQFTDAPQASFRRPGAVDLTFTKSEELMLAGFKQGDEQVAIWKITRKDKESNFPRINCFARVAGGCAVVGVGHELIGLSRSGEIGRLFLGHTATVWAVAPSPDGRLLLSASADQTLKIWSLERVDPLLTLFFADSEWVAWTPQGYYAASPGGEQLMGWHVNNGLNAMASYYPASQFRKTLHRPDVIKRLLKAGSLEMALAEADTARGEASRPTAVAQVLPPKVAITTPADAKLALSNDALEVQAVATSVGAYPVTALRLLLDGRPAPEGLKTFPNPKLGEARGSWTVAVPPGSHRLIVQADSEVSKSLSDPVEVTRGSGDAEPGKAKGVGTLYVLAIGINDYPDKRLKLDCAAPDARALRQAFLDHSRRLFHGVEVRLLLDGEATRDHILEGLGWLSATAKAGDVAVVFYAGHGDSKIENQFYLVPVDANLRDLSHSGISGEELRRGIGDLPCATMLLLDACYAGSIDVKKRKTRGLPQPSDRVVRDLVYDSGLVVMCGAWKEQEAAEENGHGFFTRALVEGMEGKADINKDGRVELYELQAYVNLRVRELSSGEQEPTISIPAIVRSFALSEPSKPSGSN